MTSAKTIIVRHWGGFGNQMFQYAFARQLSVLNDNASIKADLSFFENYYWPYQLDKLNVKNSIATKEDIFNFDNGSLPAFMGKLVEKIPWIRVKDFLRKPFSKVYTEKCKGFDEKAMNIRSDVYLKGYWFSYKYFNDIRNILLDEFSFKSEMNDNNKKMADAIESSGNSVSLHVRRGDYIKLENCKSYFRSPYADGFYNRAIAEIETRVENPVFFLFSDDPDWVKENIKINHKSVVVNINNGDNSHWDMKLMSLCKHNIIANSSFSWWGAWLNENPSKIVMAPKLWFNDKDFNISDFILPEWLIL